MKTITRRRLLLLGFLVLALALPRRSGAVETEGSKELPVTVVLVRHAETGASTRTNRDPALSEAGEERARELARMLHEAGVTHLFSSEYQRTATTLAPLAAELGLEVETVSAREGARQVEALRGLAPGSVAVVAGHSNTVPGLVTALGGVVEGLTEHPQHGPMLAHEEYDRLFVVTLPVVEDGAAKALELRYGSREESEAR